MEDGAPSRSHQRFQQRAEASLHEEYQAFCDEQRAWLDDYALFMALKTRFDGKVWTDWPEAYALRDPDTLADARSTLADEIAFHRYTQFQFFRQWSACAPRPCAQHPHHG